MLKEYLAELQKTPLLSREEETELYWCFNMYHITFTV